MNYNFRQFLDEVHRPNRVNATAILLDNEFAVDDTWTLFGDNIDALLDFQEYLYKSMNLSLKIGSSSKEIKLVSSKENGFSIDISSNGIIIDGNVWQGVIYLEDIMNLREAPFLKCEKREVNPMFSPRMIHSGWGLDQYGNSHLKAIIHAGFDSVLLFVKGVDLTTHGVMDFNDLIQRASKFNIGVYLYSYLDSFKHPDDEDADEFFERIYGAIFKQCPLAKGLILVGESAQFPSKDVRTTGKIRSYSNPDNDGLADLRPAPGWYPCSDYPQWLGAVQKAVYKYSPNAEIIFWTYNWGEINEKERIELINNLPSNITLEATFEMYETRKFPEHTTVSPDYSITFSGPGSYFSSEAKAAKKRNLKLCSMSNSGGLTWDCGVIPYIPVPQQWFKRFNAMAQAHKDWGLKADMAGHHYGWYPSVISDCSRFFFRDNSINLDDLLLKIAQRDFGEKAKNYVVDGWQYCSEAMNEYAPGFDDQAGPLRVGPAYPLIFHPITHPGCEQKMVFPTTPQSAVGGAWLHPFYNPENIFKQSYCGRRVPAEIKLLENALKTYKKGLELLEKALEYTSENKLNNAKKIVGVNIFFYCTLVTMYHTKKWWILNKRLELAYDINQANSILDEMEKLLDLEIENTKMAIPLVQYDSRLGWEPSMDYMADQWHLNWKIRQVSNVKNNLLVAYRKTIHK